MHIIEKPSNIPIEKCTWVFKLLIKMYFPTENYHITWLSRISVLLTSSMSFLFHCLVFVSLLRGGALTLCSLVGSVILICIQLNSPVPLFSPLFTIPLRFLFNSFFFFNIHTVFPCSAGINCLYLVNITPLLCSSYPNLLNPLFSEYIYWSWWV